jgi:hypothetical protein
MIYYTGVGSRKTPQDVLQLMCDIAKQLQTEGYTLRSGGAEGADRAFEAGAGLDKTIFYAKDSTPQAEAIASQFHPAWDRCSTFAKRLHGRNSFQVLGNKLDTPSKFLICWTPDGCMHHVDRTIKTGGTGTAISIADAYDVPVYNLAVKGARLFWEMKEYKQKEEHMHKLHTIYTAHYRYGGHDRTDITVKGQDSMGRFFAPTWSMVMGVKNGTMYEQEYIDKYVAHIRNDVPIDAWNWLLSTPTRTFVCFCTKDQFCHRNILLNYILSILGDRVSYGGWKDAI